MATVAEEFQLNCTRTCSHSYTVYQEVRVSNKVFRAAFTVRGTGTYLFSRQALRHEDLMKGVQMCYLHSQKIPCTPKTCLT